MKIEKKIISFCLWGNNFRYIGGAFQNIELAKIYFPDWICRFYVGKSTNNFFLDKILSFDNTEIIEMNEEGDWTGMFWRFKAICDNDVKIMISRDTDSRLSKRESEAIKEWENSNKLFHIIRDHQNHGIPILGGLWGAKKGIIDNIDKLINKFKKGDFWQVDQNFLTQYIYPIVKDDSLVHDEFFEKKNFPESSGKRNELFFVGQAYDGDGKILDNKNFSYCDFLKKEENIILNNYEDLFKHIAKE